MIMAKQERKEISRKTTKTVSNASGDAKKARIKSSTSVRGRKTRTLVTPQEFRNDSLKPDLREQLMRYKAEKMDSFLAEVKRAPITIPSSVFTSTPVKLKPAGRLRAGHGDLILPAIVWVYQGQAVNAPFGSLRLLDYCRANNETVYTFHLGERRITAAVWNSDDLFEYSDGPNVSRKTFRVFAPISNRWVSFITDDGLCFVVPVPITLPLIITGRDDVSDYPMYIPDGKLKDRMIRDENDNDAVVYDTTELGFSVDNLQSAIHQLDVTQLVYHVINYHFGHPANVFTILRSAANRANNRLLNPNSLK